MTTNLMAFNVKTYSINSLGNEIKSENSYYLKISFEKHLLICLVDNRITV